LPDTIQFGNGRQIINSYDAGGHKLTTQYYTPIGTVIVPKGGIHGGYTTANSVLRLDDYFGHILYENGTSASVHPLTKILTAEGYVDMSTSGYPYCYYKQDHLGSNREVTSYAGTTGTVVQQTEYYPSGTAYVEGTGVGVQPFKFTGKELIIMHGLNWQDYGARWLDNVRMQWTTRDLLCEKYYNISPYAYCGDNPENRVDPDGRQAPIVLPYLEAIYDVLFVGGAATATTMAATHQNEGETYTYSFNPATRTATAVYKDNPGYNNQKGKDREAKEGLDKNQANVEKEKKANLPNPSPDPNNDEGPKRPIEEWQPATIVVIGIGIAAELFKNIKEMINPTPAPKPAPKPNVTPPPFPIPPKKDSDK